MQFANTKDRTKAKKSQFPPEHRLADGESMIAFAKEVRHDVKTVYGLRSVADVVIRGKSKDENDLFSFWWPLKLPFPTLAMPFYIKRVTGKEWEFALSSNDEEAQTLWKSDRPPLGPGQAQARPSFSFMK